MTGKVSWERISRLVGLLFFTLTVSSCATGGTLKESTPLTQKLSAYPVLYVEVNSSSPKGERYLPKFKELILDGIRKENLFSQVELSETESQPTGLLLRLDMFGISEGNVLLRATSDWAGAAEFKFHAELIDLEGHRQLSSFIINSNSVPTKAETVWVGDIGVDLQNSGDPMILAMERACQRIVGYLKKNR